MSGEGRPASAARTAGGRRAPGFPAIGRTAPALALTAAVVVVGLVGSWFAVGVSGWLVASLLLVLGAAALPRGPMVALITLQWGLALVLSGQLGLSGHGYSGRFAVVLAATHFLFACTSLSAWLPTRARVQFALLRGPAVRFVVIQLVSQAVSFAVLTLVHPAGAGSGVVWLALVAAVAALALAALILAPALLRPAR